MVLKLKQKKGIKMTTEELYNRAAYPQDLPLKIEQMGSIAMSVANSWLMGWPEIVKQYFLNSQAQVYLSLLETRMDAEKDILANEANLRHLSRREILQLYEIKEDPPRLAI
jgi:hypothetical protein